MYSAIDTTSQQMFSVVGSAYIPERRNDEMHRYLPLSDSRDRAVIFDELLKALRSALSLR
jgi:hypothetical protein